MPIEKVFAIRGTPSDIYAALQRDIGSASAHEGDAFDVVRRERDHLLELRVNIGGVPSYLTYTIEAKEDHAEVTAALVPYGWRWVLFQMATLGMRRSAMEMVLVQGLANLKSEVEGDTTEQEFGDEAEGGAGSSDEV